MVRTLANQPTLHGLNCNGTVFKTACDLMFDGRVQPSNYAELSSFGAENSAAAEFIQSANPVFALKYEWKMVRSQR